MNQFDEQGAKALQHYLTSSTVVIKGQTPGFEHGTGVAVKYLNEHYIITADHVLAREPWDENLLIIGRPDSALKEVEKSELPKAFFYGTHGQIKSSTGTQLIITRRITSMTLGDIAAIMLEDVAKHLPHTVFHDLSNQGSTSISEGTHVIICGFPGEFALRASHRATDQKQVAIFTGFAWQRIIAFPKLLDLSNPIDPQIDFFTDFSLEETWDPKGMSGGGTWTIPKTKNTDLWSPSQTQLLGIQSGFYRNNNLLRLTRIDRVLELLSQ